MSNRTSSHVLRETEQAGLEETTWLRDMLTDRFHSWLEYRKLYVITEEEYEVLKIAFCDGFIQGLQYW